MEYDDLDNIRADLVEKRDTTSMHQSAEWGMRAMQASFPRLKDVLLYEERGERGLIFKSALLAFNLRARLVGINQIQNVYMPLLAKRRISLAMMYESELF